VSFQKIGSVRPSNFPKGGGAEADTLHRLAGMAAEPVVHQHDDEVPLINRDGH
jgi:hypothetical protein